MADLKLALQLKAQDYASKVVNQLKSNVNKANKEIEKSAKQTGKAQVEASKAGAVHAVRSAQMQQQAFVKTQQAAQRMALAREQLGIRSEKSIQREIALTMAAYQRLKNAGTLSSRELARAAEATKQKIAGLNAQMGKMPTGQRMGNMVRGLVGVGAGVTAGAMIMAAPMKKEMAYDRQLAMVSNTAFAERDVAGRIAGKQELGNAVRKALETGGGTKENALNALDTLLASGAIEASTAMNLLPTLQKASVATGADTIDLAKIAISSMQQFGIKEADIGEVLDKAVAAGQAGNFELADMARWLPQQMAVAKSVGFTGMQGFSDLLVFNQQARVTAGTSDEAGNNVVNFLAKLNARETNERFKNLKIKDANGQERGIDLIQSIENYKAQGKNTVEAFMAVVDQVIGEDENYQALQAKLKNAKGTEKEQYLSEMADLIEGSAIGKVLSDRQALMGFLGIRNNQALGAEVKAQVANASGAVATSHAVIADTNSYKTEDAKNTLEQAQMEGMKGFNNMLGDVSAKLAEYGKAYPQLTASLTTAGTVLASLATAAGTAGAALALLGGKGVLGGAAGVAADVAIDAATGAGAGAVAQQASKAGWARSMLGKSKHLIKWAPAAVSGLVANPTTAAIVAGATGGYLVGTGMHKGLEYVSPSYRNSSWGGEKLGYLMAMLGNDTAQQSFEDERQWQLYQILDREFKRAPMMVKKMHPEIWEERYAKQYEAQQLRQAKQASLPEIVEANAGAQQADMQQLGQAVGDGLKQALEGQQVVIENRIQVDLDGKIIAESTSENQYQMLMRG